MTVPVLSITGLGVAYESSHYREVAVEDFELSILPGEIVAVVGESGSGKTTVAKAVTGLLPSSAQVSPGGSIRINGVELLDAPGSVVEALRGAVVSFVPQDPRRSLHPLKRIGAQIGEVLLRHRVCARDDIRSHVAELLEKVGIDHPAQRARQYPHELSGGMLQRVLIAIAIAAKPALVIADEPTSALDVTVQKQVLTLLTGLVASDGISILLVTHDLELAAAYSDSTVVLHRGRLVERRVTGDFFAGPITDYTRALLRASPTLTPREPRERPAAPPVLKVENVVRELRLRGEGRWTRSTPFRPVDDVSFDVPEASTVAIVGESGAGKTSLARLVLGLDKPQDGRIVFDGHDIGRLDRAGRRTFRRATQFVPQNPASSFDPRFSVEAVIAEPLRHAGVTRGDARRQVIKLLDQVGLPGKFADKGALELSGGQQQRVAIARAISLRPRFIVCDEPTSALDVTVQARIIELLRDLQEATGISYVFISHDLAVVSELADEIVVLRHGSVVESGSAADVLTRPVHAYTRELIASVPHRQTDVLGSL
ncbi:nickel ABC transporter ATP-binding protein NikE [Aeromicrobium sp. P5_D10]